MLGKRIKLLRESRNLTQLELSKLVNISNTTLSQYESGHRAPSDGIKIKIANYFNVSVDYLLGNTDNPKPIENIIKEVGAEYNPHQHLEGAFLNNIIGKRIEKLRYKKGWSLREMGKRTQLSHDFISRVEKGETTPSFSSLESIAEALGIDIVELIADKNKYVKKEDLPNELRDLDLDYIILARELKEANIKPNTIRELVSTFKKLTGENSTHRP